MTATPSKVEKKRSPRRRERSAAREKSEKNLSPESSATGQSNLLAQNKLLHLYHLLFLYITQTPLCVNPKSQENCLPAIDLKGGESLSFPSSIYPNYLVCQGTRSYAAFRPLAAPHWRDSGSFTVVFDRLHYKSPIARRLRTMAHTHISVGAPNCNPAIVYGRLFKAASQTRELPTEYFLGTA